MSSDGEGGPDLSCFNFGDDSGDEEAAPAEETAAQMAKRHRQEEQALRTEAKAKVRGIAKGDRAGRAAADAELEAALAQLAARHAAEAGGGGDEAAAAALAQLAVSAPAGPKLSKAEKRRQKQEQEERERAQRIADEKAGAGPSQRDVELEQISAQLAPLGLAVAEVAADGHCLYRSLAHRLQAAGEAADFADCRRAAADYIRAHPSDFLPYLQAEEDGPAARALASGGLEGYCALVEGSSEWGGQLEITAIAHAKKRCIAVYSAGAQKPLLTGEEYEGDGRPRLDLSYHRHYYALGAHYNAVVGS